MWEKVCRTKLLSFVIVGVMLGGLIAGIRQLPLISLQNKLETWLSEDDEQARALRLMETYFPRKNAFWFHGRPVRCRTLEAVSSENISAKRLTSAKFERPRMLCSR